MADGADWRDRGVMESVLVAMLATNPTARMSLTGGPWGADRQVFELELFLDKMPVHLMSDARVNAKAS